MGAKDSAKKVFFTLLEGHRRRKYFKVIKKQYEEIDEKIPVLTDAQKKSIKQYWAKYGYDVPLDWHRFLYNRTGKEIVEFVPEQTFHQEIMPYMNDPKFVNIWSDKCYLDFFVNRVGTVQTVLRNVNGRYIDKDFNLISLEDAENMLNKQYESLVVKPSTETSTGKGVQLLKAPFDLKSLDQSYKRNFVFQIPLKQHEAFGKFNKSSVNTIRVNSVIMGTEIHIMSAFIKVGQAGKFADNSGHDRFFIGIKNDGTFADYAINHDMKRFSELPSGYDFRNQPVLFYDKICETVKTAHACIPHFGFAFWDIAIKEDGTPVIIEVNLRHPNAIIAQATGRPFLGEYTESVLKLVNKRKKL